MLPSSVTALPIAAGEYSMMVLTLRLKIPLWRETPFPKEKLDFAGDQIAPLPIFPPTLPLAIISPTIPHQDLGVPTSVTLRTPRTLTAPILCWERFKIMVVPPKPMPCLPEA